MGMCELGRSGLEVSASTVPPAILSDSSLTVLSKTDLNGLSNGFRSHKVSGPRLLDFLEIRLGKASSMSCRPRSSVPVSSKWEKRSSAFSTSNASPGCPSPKTDRRVPTGARWLLKLAGAQPSKRIYGKYKPNSFTPRSHPLHIGLSGPQIIELSGYFLAAEAGERL